MTEPEPSEVELPIPAPRFSGGMPVPVVDEELARQQARAALPKGHHLVVGVTLEPMEFQLKTGETVVIRRHEPRDDEAVLRNAILMEGKIPDWAEQWCKAEPYSQGVHAVVFLSIVPELVMADGQRKVIGHLAYLDSVRVSILEEWRGRGIGKMLMEVFMEWCERSGLSKTKVPLLVEKENAPARSLYERHGFVVTGELQGLLEMTRFPDKAGVVSRLKERRR